MDQRNQEHQSKAPICTPRGDESATPTFHDQKSTTPGSDNALAPGLERETWLARSASPLPVPQPPDRERITNAVNTPPSPYTEPKHRSHPAQHTPLQPQTPHRAPASWVPSYVSGPPGNISWAGAVFSGPEPDGGPERGRAGYDHDHGYGYEYEHATQAGPPAGVFAHDPAGPAPRTPLWVPAPDVDPEDDSDVSPFVLGSGVYGVYPSPPGTPRRGSGR